MSSVLQILFYHPQFSKKICRFRIDPDKKLFYENQFYYSEVSKKEKEKFKNILQGSELILNLQQYFHQLLENNSEKADPLLFIIKLSQICKIKQFILGYRQGIAEFLDQVFKFIEAGFTINKTVRV
jgi:hypothetical protein